MTSPVVCSRSGGGDLCAVVCRRGGLRVKSSRGSMVALRSFSEGLEDKVVVIGGGIGGLATSIALTKIGVDNVVLEKAAGPRAPGASISLQTNAWKALKILGVDQGAREGSEACESLEVCDSKGTKMKTVFFKDCPGGPHEFRGVRRKELIGTLHEACSQNVRYGFEIAGIDVAEGAKPAVRLLSGEALRCRAVIGADGVRSKVAAALGLGPANFAGMTAHRGMATFPRGEMEKVLPRSRIRMVWGEGKRAGMYAINDRDVYWFTVFDDDGRVRDLDPEEMAEEARGVVGGWGGGILECIENTPPGGIVRNRIVDRWVSPGSTVGRGAVTVVGDALHPMTPNLGQGGACALEGAVRLAGEISAAGGARATDDGLAEAMRRYEREQTRRALPLQVKSWGMGAALHLGSPVSAVRDFAVANVLPLNNILSHAYFDHPALSPL